MTLHNYRQRIYLSILLKKSFKKNAQKQPAMANFSHKQPAMSLSDNKGRSEKPEV